MVTGSEDSNANDSSSFHTDEDESVEDLPTPQRPKKHLSTVDKGIRTQGTRKGLEFDSFYQSRNSDAHIKVSFEFNIYSLVHYHLKIRNINILVSFGKLE